LVKAVMARLSDRMFGRKARRRDGAGVQPKPVSEWRLLHEWCSLVTWQGSLLHAQVRMWHRLRRRALRDPYVCKYTHPVTLETTKTQNIDPSPTHILCDRPLKTAQL